jgi:hypothetical protein
VKNSGRRRSGEALNVRSHVFGSHFGGGCELKADRVLMFLRF